MGNNISKFYGKLHLRTIIVVPFLLQLVTAVGLTGWLSFRNGQEAVNELATQLQVEIGDRVGQHLDVYLATPHLVNKINVNALKLGFLNFKDLEKTGKYFWKQLQVLNVSYIVFANTKGEYIGAYHRNNGIYSIDIFNPSTKGKIISYGTDGKGNRTKVIEVVDNYNFKEEPWYADAVRSGKPVWSQIYQYKDEKTTLAISASYPIYDRNKNLIGVMGIDLILSQVSDFLRNLKVTREAKVFILERNGLLVASSAPEKPFTFINGEAKRLKASESNEPLIRETTQNLMQRFGNLNEIRNSERFYFNLNGKREFVQVKTWQDEYGLDWLIVVVIPEAEFMKRIHANTQTTIILCAGSLIIAIFLGWKTSKWIVKPILALNNAAKKISERDWEQKIPTGRSYEIQQLAKSFKKMTLHLKESFENLEQKVKDRTAQLAEANSELEQKNALIRKVFGRYLTNEIVATLIDNLEGLKLGGERRIITILTSDLRGFTATSERFPAEKVVEILNFYLEHMADVITKYQGTIDEFMGDGILVLFGAPTARENDAKRAVACAVEMQLAMLKVNEQMKTWSLPPLEMGIGINTGEVVVGNIGSEKRTKYGVVGSQVNLTYRIESYTIGGQILISESTLREAGEIVKIKGQKQVQPKGVNQLISIYDVDGIGGEYDLFLTKAKDELFRLSEVIPIQYTILDGKHISSNVWNGTLVELSAKEAKVSNTNGEGDEMPPPMTNIRLKLLAPNDGRVGEEDIYAKVLEAQAEKGNFYIHFTFIPPSVKEKLEEIYKSSS
ncbi:adenylate/guanylate cyclase domain-containing protein [Aerosakkonema funiforme]|uniref:HAMP domain-containing protein n=1 Tax=Aerosakkonema funiforme FACHB-1375 TaxID=2949571 RepID=A0A926VL31_9CYAN|nr:adenylate/guanylate cyclase domain-containing protein [Aerosakkonema funiforme]MBD2184409.1 HAMP domain-containing protein [Aerosakkonema funiforme FACHB-1375]